jgi:predicted glutamine amidotransferase
MCLLIVQSKDTEFTNEHLADFYTRNRDGIGVMWAEGGYLHQEKIIPRDVNDAVDFYNTYARGRDACVHYRMRTHGDIDYDNCHPYEVFGFTEEAEMPMLLMHNGVLHTGNYADTSKSDTYHYIKDYLRVLLAADPSLAFTPEFNEIIGKHIGNNRFAIMNHAGQIAVINKHQGVTFQGAWLSNEYAWSAQKYLPRKATYYTPSMTSKWGNWNPTTQKFEEPAAKKSGSPAKVAKVGKKRKQYASMDGASTSNGGKKPTGLTKTEKNSVNGVSVDCDYLDDVLEIRSMLDAFYIENGTTNKQIECMIEEMGVTKAYLAVELLGDGLISEKMWDIVSTNRTEMKWFRDQPMSNWYPDRKVESIH